MDAMVYNILDTLENLVTTKSCIKSTKMALQFVEKT